MAKETIAEAVAGDLARNLLRPYRNDNGWATLSPERFNRLAKAIAETMIHYANYRLNDHELDQRGAKRMTYEDYKRLIED